MWAFQRCIAGLQRMKTHGERDHSRYKKIVNFRLRRAPRAACNRAFLWEFSKVLKSPHKKFAFFVCTSGPPWRGPLGLCASKKGRKKSIKNWPKQPGGPVGGQLAIISVFLPRDGAARVLCCRGFAAGPFVQSVGGARGPWVGPCGWFGCRVARARNAPKTYFRLLLAERV